MKMDKYCRGCLVRYEEPTELLQYTEKNRRLFVYCTGLQVKRTDSFTFQLCRSCYMNMKVACNFKKQCRNSDKLFKSYEGIRENGDNVDLSTFLKNNDDSWNFRFPGNSTPAHQRIRDDDNESTTTSIRNFMNDIMMPDELPDTEARIIREVIDEEADVSDDSLDSHWLQDDASIDSNFKLDFSFSPFSTPRPVNNDRYTPNKESLIKTKNNADEPKQISEMKILDSLYMPKILEPLESPKDLGNLDMPLIDEDSSHVQMPLLPIKEERHFDETMDSLDVVNDFLKCENENTNCIEPESSQCTIDRNLEEALKNTDNKEFSLDELLVSPKVIPNIKSPATPFINNILFGDKLDLSESSSSSPKYKSGQCIETFENVKGDVEIIGEFTSTTDVKLEEIDLEELKTEMIDEIDKDVQAQLEDKKGKENESLYNITNFYCNMCRKQFKSLVALQRHSKLQHQNKLRPHRVWICDYCAREFTDRTNLRRHIERIHLRPSAPKLICEICNMEFQTKNALKQHKRAHTNQGKVVNTTRKRFVCPECGASTDKASNHAVHMKRHTKNYTHICSHCQKGYCRQADLTIHMRCHTGEKPFPCPHCDLHFARRDSLTHHIKNHLDLKPYKCVYCKSRFIKHTSLRGHLRKSKNCLKQRELMAQQTIKLEEERTENNIVTEAKLVKGNVVL